MELVSGGFDGTARVWDLLSGDSLGEPMTGQQIKSLAIAELGGRQVIISGGATGEILVRDAVSGALRVGPIEAHRHNVNCIAVSDLRGRSLIVSGGHDGTVRVWDLASGTPLGEPLQSHATAVNAIAMTEIDGRNTIVSGGADGALRLFDLFSGQPLGGVLRTNSPVQSIAVGDLGGRIAVVSGNSDGMIRCWDPISAAINWEVLTSPWQSVRALARARIQDEELIVSGGHDGFIRLWDLQGRECYSIHLGGFIYSLACGPNGLVGLSTQNGMLVLQFNVRGTAGSALTSSS
jgi:WD40 repeat protein